MTGLLGPMMVIVWKDVLLELRSRDLVVSVVVFGLLVVVVFNFALNNTPGRSEELAPGILWSAFALCRCPGHEPGVREGPGAGRTGGAANLAGE